VPVALYSSDEKTETIRAMTFLVQAADVRRPARVSLIQPSILAE
jgi:hypothetical protein